MNILYHHRTQGKGVEGVHIREMARALTQLGHQVDILSPSGLKNEGTRDEACLPDRQGRGTKSKIYSIISKILPEFCFEILEIFYNFIAITRMKKVLEQKKYGLIYERYAIFNWSGIKAAKRYHIPIILEVNYTSFTPLYRKRNGLLKPLAHRWDRKIFAAADGIMVVSTYLKDQLRELGIAENKIIVCPNAADPERFNPEAIKGERVRAKLGLSGKQVIGFIGGFYPWHGLEMLVDSFSEIKRTIKDVALLLIGDGPSKKAIKTRVRGSGLEKDVVFVNQVAHGEIPLYIAAFDIAVMPDSNNYGSPMKIYEYMAMGKPVVAPRLGPLEDGIEDGKEGLLFTPQEKAGLIKSIKALLEDTQLRQNMSVAARGNILKRHTWEKNAEAILGLYGYRKIEGDKIYFAK
jgi:glycosyltransferase involved in cell wall biosynthesis